MVVLRGLYVTIICTLALPLFILGAIFYMGWMLYLNLRYDKRLNMKYLKTSIKAVKQGIAMGHRQNVLFIMYGKHYPKDLGEL